MLEEERETGVNGAHRGSEAQREWGTPSSPHQGHSDGACEWTGTQQEDLLGFNGNRVPGSARKCSFLEEIGENVGSVRWVTLKAALKMVDFVQLESHIVGSRNSWYLA